MPPPRQAQGLLLSQLLAVPPTPTTAAAARAAGGSSQQAQALQLSGPAVSGQQHHLGPLLAGRLAALAAMRRLRRSSVAENDPHASSAGGAGRGAPQRAALPPGVRSSGTGACNAVGGARAAPDREACGAGAGVLAGLEPADLRDSAEFSRTAALAVAAGLQPEAAAQQRCLGSQGASPVPGLGALRSSLGNLPAAVLAAGAAASLDASATLEEQASALLRRLLAQGSAGSGSTDGGSEATLGGTC